MTTENDQLLHDLFSEHVQKIQIYYDNSNISHRDLLKLYGLYQQSVKGDIVKCDNFRSFKEKKMYESWQKYSGKNSDVCKQLFINVVNNIMN